jgi:DNA-binding MarR family transcriptional regulator
MIPPDPAAEPGSDLAPRLRLAVARLHRRLRQSAEPGLTISQLSTLASIERHAPVTLGELARVEQVQPPTITALVGKLEAAGLVGRTIDETDRRIHRVDVTPAGSRWLHRHRTRKNAYLAKKLRALPPDDRATLARAAELMERIVAEDEQ